MAKASKVKSNTQSTSKTSARQGKSKRIGAVGTTKIRRVKAKDPVTTRKRGGEGRELRKNTKKRINIPKLKFKKVKIPKWLKIIGKPFVKIFGPAGRYVKGSFQELRQTKWPNRRSTWVLTLAVIVFAVAFAAIILGIDHLFDLVVKNVIL